MQLSIYVQYFEMYIIIKDIIIKEQLRIVSKIIFLIITVIIVLLEKQQNYKMKIIKEIFYYE